MPYGYSYFDIFWKKKEKIRVLKKISVKEALIYTFFHSLIFVSLYATIFVLFLQLLFYGVIKPDIYILVLIALFSPFVTQSIFRTFIYIKYDYYKNNLFKVLAIFSSIIRFSIFLLAMNEISNILSFSFVRTFIHFLVEYVALILINLMFFNPRNIRKRKP
tara:strand:- start:312 stop:794 length:483 start_codon:yes stop_codon:yes gene_type:complete